MFYVPLIGNYFLILVFLFPKTFLVTICSVWGCDLIKMAFQLTFVGAASAILQLFDNAIFHCAKLYHFIDGLLVIILEVTTHRTQNVGQVIFHQENFYNNARFKHFLFSRMFWFFVELSRDSLTVDHCTMFIIALVV